MERKRIENNWIDTKEEKISVIISVFNEEDTIAKRIENLNSFIGKGLIEILIASDGSTDNTVKRVKELENKIVKLIVFKQNKGKALVHNECAKVAKGDILIFTDAETSFDKNFFKFVLPHFADPQVGAVCGRIHYINENKSYVGRSAGIYWKFEDKLRRSLSALGLLVFGTGACMAVKKSNYCPIDETEDVDFALTMEIVAMGYKIIYEPLAIAYDYISETQYGTFKTKIQQTSQSYKSIAKRLFTKKFLKRPITFFTVLCHKTFRHLSPFFMLSMLITNALISNMNFFYSLTFSFQVLFYSLALIGFFIQKKGYSLFNLPLQFIVLNLSRAIGVLISIIGKQKGPFNTTR